MYMFLAHAQMEPHKVRLSETVIGEMQEEMWSLLEKAIIVSLARSKIIFAYDAFALLKEYSKDEVIKRLIGLII